jgi:hypothetical protein
MRVSNVLLGIAAVAISATTAMGQSFNIDFGNTAPGAGSPAASYGAAAGQVGTWQTIASVVAGGAGVTLNDLTGAPTLAKLVSATANPSFGFNNAGTSGNDQLLMDDILDLGGAGSTDTFTITNLTNGTYDVYTYAMAPDSNTFITSVNVNATGAQNVGGAWVPGFSQGVTHAKHTVTITNGTITINTATVTGFSSLNGLQIVLVPAPGSIALLGLAGLCGPRRRRA